MTLIKKTQASNKYHVNGSWYVDKDEIPEFFAQFLPFDGASIRGYEIPDYLRDCAAPWAQALVSMYEEKVTYPASLSPDQGQLLKTLVCNSNPRTIMEIGCFTGVSTTWLASGLQ